MKKIKLFVAAVAVFAVGAFALVPATTVGALDPLADVCTADPNSQVCQSKDDDANALIKTLVNVLLFLVGAISTIMLIVGGIMYATSTGDSGRITKAKNTIMYSIVGLVVAFLSYAIVFWVLKVL